MSLTPQSISPCRVAVADDHPMVANTITNLLTKHFGCEMVGVASSGQEAVDLCDKEQPDVLVLDLMMPDLSGQEVMHALRAKKSKTNVLVYSGLSSATAIKTAYSLGAVAFVRKSEPISMFLDAFRLVRAGKVYIGPEECGALREMLRSGGREKLLSPIEREVLQLYTDDVPIKSIAVDMDLSVSAVYKAITRIKVRSGCNTLQELKAYALEMDSAASPSDTEDPV